MANYNYRSQFEYSYSAKAVVLRLSVSFAGSGAPTIVSGTGMGISGITRNSAGDYSIALSHAFAGLMGLSHVFNSGSAAPAAPGMYIKTNSVAVSAAPLVRVVFNAAGTATDPASGEVVLLEILLNDSSLGY